MKRDIAVINRNFKELNPLVCGFENCEPSHSFGPKIREYYLLHYVRNGSGVLYNKQGVHKVRAGQVFIIRPGEVTTYTADRSEPWSYIWIGFDGDMAKRLEAIEDSVIDYTENTFSELIESQLPESTREEFILGKLFIIFSHIFNKKNISASYEKQIADYIRANYMRQIRVESIAKMLGLDRRYMSRIFKDRTGMTVQEFLINTRLKVAAGYLSRGRSVTDAALLSGYTDVFNFSKIFKKMYGVSPKKYIGRSEVQK